MDNLLLKTIVGELDSIIVGTRLRRAHQLASSDLLMDFDLRDNRRLFITTNAKSPALFLTTKTHRDHLDKARTDTQFISLLRKYLYNARLVHVEKLEHDRIVKFEFAVTSESKLYTLVIKLTGRSSDVLILEDAHIIGTLRNRSNLGDVYSDPVNSSNQAAQTDDLSSRIEKTDFPSINEACDTYYSELYEQQKFEERKRNLHSQLNTKLKKNRSLITNLQRDLEGFAKGEIHQRYGELLMASLHSAKLENNGFKVIDLYDENQSEIVIPSADKGTPLEAAEQYFKLARKAKNGVKAITNRIPVVDEEVRKLERQISELDKINNQDDLITFSESIGIVQRDQSAAKSSKPASKKKEVKIAGVRRYQSGDGYEILVGRTDKDNDNLTFKVAKSYDIWFHTADYPGSHVVIRNPQRSHVPHKTIVDAARLAAKFSTARNSPKVAVNYCERKYISKMKGFAPGQVRISSFKTVIVEPGEP